MKQNDRVKMDYKPKPAKVRALSFRPYSKIFFKCSVTFVIFFALLNFVSLARGSYKNLTHHSFNNFLTEEIKLPAVNLFTVRKATSSEPIVDASWSTLKVRSGDNLGLIFKKLGLPSNELSDILSIGKNAKFLKELRPGQTIKVLLDKKGHLLAIQQKIDPLKTLTIERNNGKFKGSLQEALIEQRIAFGKAHIQDSLFGAGKKSKLEDKLIMELADIFAYDIDFALDIQPNDSFKVLYEEKFADGKKIGVGNVLAAEFTNQGKTYRAIRYVSQGKAEYFSPNGKGLKKAFIRTPVNYTHISSYFNLQRKHPILHKIRAHRGVDYAAPTGTPVKAAGDGNVIFLGRKGGYGNTLILQHGERYTTLYAHLSNFKKSLRVGSKVRQGDIIAYVGSSGLATGPHLHYEFRVDGVHRDPLTVALPNSDGMQGKQRHAFLAHADRLIDLMNHHDKVMLASTEFTQ